MLEQTTHWLEIGGAALDALLLLRVLQLRLHKVYAFLTLACLLSLFYDAVALWLGSDSETFARVFVYSRFLYAFIYPLALWDVFEQMADQVGKIRRMATSRLISAIVLTTIFAFLVAGTGEGESSGAATTAEAVGIILWVGTSVASLTFLFTMERNLKGQHLEIPHNTYVWMRYFQLSLVAEVVNCFTSLLISFAKKPATLAAVNITLSCYAIVITAWCLVRLRMIQSDVPSAPQQA